MHTSNALDFTTNTHPHTHTHYPSYTILRQTLLSECHTLLDLRDRQCRIQALRARPRAVKNSVTSVQAHAVVERILARKSLLVTRIGDPAVGLEKDGGTEVFFAVPPV